MLSVMTDPISIISFASALIQLTEFSTKVAIRLYDFQSRESDLPKALHAIRIKLPLITDAVDVIHGLATTGKLGYATQPAVLNIVQACKGEIQNLDTLLNEILPASTDSRWKRGVKAIASLKQERKIQQINFYLKEYLEILCHYRTIRSRGDQMDHSMFHDGPLCTIPFSRDDDFVGRSGLLSELNTRLLAKHRLSLTGIGGVGKSQIAIEYCHTTLQNDPRAHVFWVHASNPARFDEAYRNIARKLSLPHATESNYNALSAVFEWLSHENQGRWLMVLDGADDAKTFFDRDFARSLVGQDLAAPLASYIPHSEQGFVLITTRDRRLGERLADFNHPLVVPYLEETDAVALLSKKLSAGCDDESRIAELVFELGNLPLAVTQAAAFINENNISVGEYISVLQQSSPVATDLLSEGLADSRRDQSHNSVIRTWGVSFDQILREKPRAAEILSLMACLDRQGIPKTLLRREDESPVGFITALGTLHAFSLIAISPNNATLEMHRLVHLSVQKWLDVTSTRTIYQDEAIKVLSKQFPSKRYEDWYTCRVLYPHAQAALEYTPMSHAALLLRASLLASVSWYDEQQGRFHLAIEKAKDSLQIRERLLDSEHQDTLMSLELVADAADGLDDFRVADEILTRLLAIRERNVGLEHPSTLKTMDSLAQLIARQCQYNRARLLIERTIKLRAKSLGLEHRDTLKSMNTLASILSSVQEFDRAHEIHQKLYEIRSRILGSAHPETLTSLHNLALAVSRQGKYKEAEEMYRQALRGREEALGSDHSSTLTTTNNLAVLLAQQARYEQSEALHRKTLQARQKALGYEHLSTLMAMSNLGDCLRLQDKQIEARGLFIEIYECAKKKYGNAHEYTAMWKDKITLLEKDGADAA